MTVYIQGSMVSEDYSGLVSAKVTAVHEGSIDLKLTNGHVIFGWSAKAYDQYENEIPLETIRRDFVSDDISALKARIEELERMMTDV